MNVKWVNYKWINKIFFSSKQLVTLLSIFFNTTHICTFLSIICDYFMSVPHFFLPREQPSSLPMAKLITPLSIPYIPTRWAETQDESYHCSAWDLSTAPHHLSWLTWCPELGIYSPLWPGPPLVLSTLSLRQLNWTIGSSLTLDASKITFNFKIVSIYRKAWEDSRVDSHISYMEILQSLTSSIRVTITESTLLYYYD